MEAIESTDTKQGGDQAADRRHKPTDENRERAIFYSQLFDSLQQWETRSYEIEFMQARTEPATEIKAGVITQRGTE